MCIFIAAQKLGSHISLLEGFLPPGKGMAFVGINNRRNSIYGLILLKYGLLNILPGSLSSYFFNNHQIAVITTYGKFEVNAICYFHP